MSDLALVSANGTPSRTCKGCGTPISALAAGAETCGKLRCRRHMENERRRGILDAIIATLQEASKAKEGSCEHSQDFMCSSCFAGELLETLAKVGLT